MTAAPAAMSEPRPVAADGTGTSPALARFTRAQDASVDGFEAALRELRDGRKKGHWIWYVFPQLAGLGRSDTSRYFGIDGIEEARAYLADPLLRGRLATAVEIVADQVGPKAIPLPVLMGSTVDATKLVSSLTLFEHTAAGLDSSRQNPESQAFATQCAVLLGIAASQGFPRCRYTLDRITD